MFPSEGLPDSAYTSSEPELRYVLTRDGIIVVPDDPHVESGPEGGARGNRRSDR